MSDPRVSAGLSRQDTTPIVPPSGTGNSKPREHQDRARALELDGAPALQRVHLRRQAAMPFPPKKPSHTPARKADRTSRTSASGSAPPNTPGFVPPPASQPPRPPSVTPMAQAPPQQYQGPYMVCHHALVNIENSSNAGRKYPQLHGPYAPVPYVPVMPQSAPVMNPQYYHHQNPIAAQYVPAPPVHGTTTTDAPPPTPQNSEDSKNAWLLWNQLTPTQQQQLLAYHTQQSQTLAQEAEEASEMTVDEEWDAGVSGKGKGPASENRPGASATHPGASVSDDNTPKSPSPGNRASTIPQSDDDDCGTPRPDDYAPADPPTPPSPYDGLTNQFGKLLLHHVQDSHDKMAKLMGDLIAQQSQAQEHLRYTRSHS
ncbi:hypothetical protein C8Q70DRAFT_1054077 [Cubamyces menziesii]|nr:hypothetical protein C8Q70DRAFT_1054077 [Cubamyces menziesii]